MSPDAIRAWRESVGLSQAKAARRIGVATRTWERWESGDRTPPVYLERVLRDVEREIAVGGGS